MKDNFDNNYLPIPNDNILQPTRLGTNVTIVIIC